MKIYPTVILIFISCCLLFLGCAGKSNLEIQKKLLTMSDTELVNHYKMLEMRMNDIDRKREHSIDQEHDMYRDYYPKDPYNYLGHLHISDQWNVLRKEKQLTQIEMRKRGLSPP